MATNYGYEFGNPFGDPNKFTRGTQEDEVDRFNQYLRGTDYWKQARGTSTGDFNDQQKSQLESSLAAQGITVPKDFHIDEGGNFNQKSRVKKGLAIAGIIGGTALGGLGLAGLGPLSGLGGLGGGAGAATSAATGATVPTAVGSNLAGGIIAGGGGLGASGGGMGLGGVLGGISKVFGGPKGIADLAGAGLSGFAKSSAENRGAQLDASLAGDEMNLRRSQEDRTERDDLWRRLLQAEYVKNWQAPTQQFSPYTRAIQGPSDAAKQGAGALSETALARLMGGSSLPAMTDINKYSKPGGLERIAGIAAPFLGAIGGRR